MGDKFFNKMGTKMTSDEQFETFMSISIIIFKLKKKKDFQTQKRSL